MNVDGPSALPEQVVLVLIDLAGGGTQKVVEGLALELLDAGSTVTIVTNGTDDDRWLTVRDRARIVELEGRLTTSDRTGLPSVRTNLRWLRRAALDLRATVRASGPQAPVLAFLPGTNVLTALACLGMRRPLVLSERNDLVRQRLSLAMRLARRLLYPTATVVTTNRAQCHDRLRSIAGHVPVRIIRNPPPSVGALARPADSRRIICAGRLTRHKRHRDIIAAFAEIAGASPGWSLRILGDGPERNALSQQALALGIHDRVDLAGWSPNVGMELSEAAIFVHASEYEGTSNAVLEAMTAGLPVLISEASLAFAPAESERPGAVTTFPTARVDDLARAMHTLVTRGELRAQQGHAARELALSLVNRPLSEWTPVIRQALDR